MKNVLFFAVIVFSLFSCKTANQILVPNELNVHRKNIAKEYYNIAEAYSDLKKYDKAISYYKLSMRDSNLYSAAYYKLGRTYVLTEKYSEAEKVFVDLLKSDEENQTFKISLAYIYGKTGKYEKACGLYSSLLETNPDDSTILQNYIYILIAQDNFTEAETQFLILKQKFPELKELEEIQKLIYKNLDKDSN